MKTLGLTAVLFTLSLSVSAQKNNESSSTTNRVVGGGLAMEQEYPWMVSLTTSNGDPGCGASLIAPGWVLTAGHCSINFPGAPQITGVIINSLIIDQNALEPFSEYIDAETVIVHEDYDMFSGGPDIALVKLAAPSSITPVGLAGYADSALYAPNMPVKILGWGKTTAGGSNVDSLRVATCQVISHDTCAVLYSSSPQGMYSSNPGGNICAGFFSGSAPAGAAQGDSGGPLVYESNGSYKQVGIVSGGNSDVTTEDYPGVFTLVPKYREWIDSVITSYSSSQIQENVLNQPIITYNLDGFVEINNLNEHTKYSIKFYNNSGKEVVEELIVSGTTGATSNLSSLQSGLYFVHVLESETNSITTSMISIAR